MQSVATKESAEQTLPFSFAFELTVTDSEVVADLQAKREGERLLTDVQLALSERKTNLAPPHQHPYRTILRHYYPCRAGGFAVGGSRLRPQRGWLISRGRQP